MKNLLKIGLMVLFMMVLSAVQFSFAVERIDNDIGIESNIDYTETTIFEVSGEITVVNTLEGTHLKYPSFSAIITMIYNENPGLVLEEQFCYADIAMINYNFNLQNLNLIQNNNLRIRFISDKFYNQVPARLEIGEIIDYTIFYI